MARFFNLLRGKQLANFGGATSNAVTDAQVAQAGTALFLQPSNRAELQDLILVNSARESQRLYGNGVPHPELSAVSTANLTDSESPILEPTGKVNRIVGLTITNGSGSTAATMVYWYNGTTKVGIWSGNIANGATQILVTPAQDTGAPTSGTGTLTVTEDCYIAAHSDQASGVVANLAYHTISEA